ncbi:MAG TPA: hypothetical protein IAC04_01300 [Candidatus Coprenecus stercoravium]|uniref:Uncharacterized protein n=1 Tax=Candidatus Coprenecus stercoravium TaxID=2840735 RepID=A0A9D2K9E6_9BACT|nr:hypothetical protein [Candidatus Coprenecus stercoravium]
MNGKPKYAGAILTAAVHCLLLLLLVSADISSAPAPQRTEGMLIEFPEEEPEPVKSEPVPVRTAVGIEPRAAEASPKEEARLVQRSESPAEAIAENINSEATVADDGDVEIPEPPREKPVNRRALFPGSGSSKDTTAVHTAEKASFKLHAGHPQGNTGEGNPDGKPTARLEGRTVMGNLPLPEYSVEKSGTVVVRILVDQYGNVTSATPGIKGTTVQDAVLWEAAKEAALKAKFNLSADAPAVQEGSISYVFTLR